MHTDSIDIMLKRNRMWCTCKLQPVARTVTFRNNVRGKKDRTMLEPWRVLRACLIPPTHTVETSCGYCMIEAQAPFVNYGFLSSQWPKTKLLCLQLGVTLWINLPHFTMRDDFSFWLEISTRRVPSKHSSTKSITQHTTGLSRILSADCHESPVVGQFLPKARQLQSLSSPLRVPVLLLLY